MKKFDEDDMFFIFVLFLAVFFTICISILLTWD